MGRAHATERRRDQLLQLGLNLFASRPYEDVAIEDIAAAAGISKGLLYHYFGSKRSFYAACVRVIAERLVDRLQQVDTTDPIGAVRDGIHQYLVFLDGHEAVYRALIQSGLGADPDVHAALRDARQAVAVRIQAELGLHEPRPVFRNAVHSWLGGIEAAALDRLLHRDLDPARFAELQTRSLGFQILDAAATDPGAPVAEERLVAIRAFLG